MLAELASLHDLLDERMAIMRRLVHEEQLQRERVSFARLELSRCSSARSRHLTERVFPYLLARLTGEEADQVRQLQAAMVPIRATSAAHVTRWPSEAVAADWPSYRQASHAILAMMAARIAEERAILYPLLKRLQHGEGR
ncbi:hypothetical protein [Sphingomonas morindae]|uniref:Uncharacterized protein n=1 Tax=Sphingomonas morindae TaxID=1541170 RepID=A0ABY4X750_9SPHN|nr:hypothetical protein [Sphingomonas morindae]USI72679.1 hypothetical protein LHA26_15580 [Sphingomonas morindae]